MSEIFKTSPDDPHILPPGNFTQVFRMEGQFFAAAALLGVMAMSVPAAAQSPILGYVTHFVEDVPRALAFYEKAFGVTAGRINAEKTFGEMDTGTTRLSFATIAVMKSILPTEMISGQSPGSEISFITPDVHALFDRAVRAGAKPVLEPVAASWGQTVAYVRDADGYLVGIASPLP